MWNEIKHAHFEWILLSFLFACNNFSKVKSGKENLEQINYMPKFPSLNSKFINKKR
jgi:hypothetical protein